MKSMRPGVELITVIDELSDVLCSVVDMSEFVRHTHPDRAFVQVGACVVKGLEWKI